MVDIKKAYLAAAREAHPDLNSSSGSDRDEQMRLVNAAWAVLGDVDARMAYDKQRLQPSEEQRRSRPRAQSTGAAPFTPFDSDDDDGFDERDDRPITRSGLPSWLPVLPAALVATGAVLILFGSLAQVGAIAGFGLVAIAVGVVGFVALPIVNVAVAARSERNR